MSKRLLFIHGAGDGGYEADKAVAASLQTALGKGYMVSNPEMQWEESTPDFGWMKQIGERTGDDLIQAIKDNTGGFTIVLDGLKAWLEFGIELNLVRDKFPNIQ